MPDPEYPPEFEALDLAFNRALNAVEDDERLARKLWHITRAMSQVASSVHTRAEYKSKGLEGVE